MTRTALIVVPHRNVMKGQANRQLHITGLTTGHDGLEAIASRQLGSTARGSRTLGGHARYAKGTETRTEAEAGDALMELNAGAAGLEALKKMKQAPGEKKALLEFGDLARGEFAPAGGNGSALAEAIEKQLDLGKGEIHFSGKADEQNAIESLGGVAPLARDACGGWKQADFFVIADSGGGDAGLRSELADFHWVVLSAWQGRKKPSRN